jgi:hypothetical protein
MEFGRDGIDVGGLRRAGTRNGGFEARMAGPYAFQQGRFVSNSSARIIPPKVRSLEKIVAYQVTSVHVSSRNLTKQGN